ncbi:MAG: SDR family oxidoreductase [Aeromicrobium sp.]
MAQIAIVGGHGKIALLLAELLSSKDHVPLSLVRNPAYCEELERLGATVRILDIERASVDDFAAAFAGSDAIVFAAGGGPDGNIERKQTVDLGGSLKSIEGAKLAGIRRFVQISAIGVDNPVPGDASDVWKAYVEAKREADAALRGSDLDWTIIRPGALTDDEPTGKVLLAAETARASIPRADVATIIAAVLDDHRTVNKQWEAVSGDMAIDQAINAAL